jgi:hypothetical protein
MKFVPRIEKESPVLEQINRLEAERTRLLQKDNLNRHERARLAELRDVLAELWQKRRHEMDPYYTNRDYAVSAASEDEMFFRDNRRGPRLRTRLPKGDRDAA